MNRIYILTSEQMQSVNDLLCAMNRAKMQPQEVTAVKKAINILARTTSVKGEDSISDVINKIGKL